MKTVRDKYLYGRLLEPSLGQQGSLACLWYGGDFDGLPKSPTEGGVTKRIDDSAMSVY